MIRLSKLTKRYGPLTAVGGIDLEIRRGECFGLLGPNGAGKTTTLRLMLGLTRPDDGEVTVFGRRVEGPDSEHQRRIGVVFETANLYEEASVEDNLAYAATLYRAPMERVDEVIEKFELAPHRKKKGRHLSKGIRQRTALARSLVHDPELLVLDEPTSGLDPDVAQQVRAIIAELHEAGKTLLLISHLMQEVEQLCSRVAIIKDGQIRAEGTVSELQDLYTDRLTLRLRGSRRSLEEAARRNGLEVIQETANSRVLLGEAAEVWPIARKLLETEEVLDGIKELHVSGMSFEDVYIRVVNQP